MASVEGEAPRRRKGDCVFLCELSSLQKALYTILTEQEDFKLVAKSQDLCACNSGEQQGYCCQVNNKKGQRWFELVSRCTVVLLKCANHVGLLLSSRQDHDDNMLQRSLQKVFRKHPELLGLSSAASFLTLSSPQYCGKLKVLEKLLPRLKIKTEKVVFYTHSNQMVAALEEFLLSLKYSYITLDNKISFSARQQMMEQFRDLSSTEFILLCCAEPGIDYSPLTESGMPLLVYDPCFSKRTNPRCAVCCTKSVPVYKLIAVGTIEEMLYMRDATGCHGTPAKKGEDSLFSYFDLFTFHSTSVSTGRKNWQVTTKTVEGVCISQLSSSNEPTAKSDSGIAEPIPGTHPLSPVSLHSPLMESVKLPTASPLKDDVCNRKEVYSLRDVVNTFDDASDDDNIASTGTIPPVLSPKKLKKGRVSCKPVMSRLYQRKKKVRKGLVYESETEDSPPLAKKYKRVPPATPSGSRPPGDHTPLFSVKSTTSTGINPPSDHEVSLSNQDVSSSGPGGSLALSHHLSNKSTDPYMGDSPELFSPPPQLNPVNMDELFGM